MPTRFIYSFRPKASFLLSCLLVSVYAATGGPGTAPDGKVSLKRANDLAAALPAADPWLKVPDASTLAWGESYRMGAFLNLYEATGNVKYLKELVFRGKRLLKHRDDKRGVADGSGHIRPAWSMASKYVVAEGALTDTGGLEIIRIRSTPSAYNNFTTIEVKKATDSTFHLQVSNEHFKRYETFENLSLHPGSERYILKIVNDPLAPYSTRPGEYAGKPSNLVRIETVSEPAKSLPANQKVALSPIPLAFTGYLGVIYSPMLRFAEMVRKDPKLKRFAADAEAFITAAEESYADAAGRVWRDGPNKEEGYYLMCEKGESMPADNVGQPFNYLARHVSSELALYRLTGKADYLLRSKKMINLFKNRLLYDFEKDLYTWNYWYEPMTTVGWKPEDNISYNVKFYEGRARVEDISHGGHDIQMVMEAYRMGIGFDSTDIKRFANTFLKNVLSADGKNITRLVDGTGDYQAYFNAIYQWFDLAEVVPDVVRSGKKIYEARKEETLPFTARLLKYRELFE